jgi:hypothetical protein
MEMTRGEIMDHLANFASESSEYRKALIENPRDVVSKQFAMDIPEVVTLKVIEDTAETIHIVLPHTVDKGEELSDADLEAVAGGITFVKDASCKGDTNTLVSIEASL